MRNFLLGVLGAFCLSGIFPIASLSPNTFEGRKCAIRDCRDYEEPLMRDALLATSTVGANGWIVGEIKALAFGGDNPKLTENLARRGWVECAGQSIQEEDFPEATAILQDTWGSMNATKTIVYLPDLRGLVLRGWQHGRHAPAKYPFSPYSGDVDLASRVFPRPELLDLPSPGIAGPTDAQTKQMVKDHVGSMQPEQFHGHRHAFSYAGTNGAVQIRAQQDSKVSSAGEPVRIGGGTSFEGGNETHPPNVYVLYVVYLGRPASEVSESIDGQRRVRALPD